MPGGRRALLPRPGAAVNENFDSGQQAFNVMHGSAPAQGDDRADDSHAIQHWLDRAVALGGHAVFLPPGRYRIARTLEVGSGVTLEGVGAASVLVAAEGLVGPLVRIPDGTQQATLRDLVLEGSTPIEVGAGVVGLVIGHGPSGTVDARVFGLSGDARFLAACSIDAGSRTVTCDAGALDGSEVGWTFEVVGGGAPDSMTPTPGRQNWQGTVASVDAAAGTFTADADPPASNPSASGLRGTVAQPIETAITAAEVVTATGGGTLQLGAGQYFTTTGVQATSGMTIAGDGQDRTIIRCGQQAPGIKMNGAEYVTIRDLTVEGAGPDGGATGGTNSTGNIDILNSSHVVVERVTTRYGAIGFAARMQNTFDVTFRDCRAEDITTSNGVYSALASGGIGFWLFNAADIHLDRCTTIRTDRHGIYFDPGTGTAGFEAADQHQFLDRCSGTTLRVHQAARSGLGLGISLSGCRSGVFSDLAVFTVGDVGGLGTYADCGGLLLGGDQHGEYARETLVTGVLLKDIGGCPLNIQGRGVVVRGVKVVGFNRKGGTAERAVVFDSYGGYTATNVLAGPDVQDNVVDGLEVEYDGTAALYDFGVRFVGGTAVPDGSTRTRTLSADGGITGATTTFTSASGAFVNAPIPSGDVGASISIPQAGMGGGSLITTIASVTNATTVEVALAATATVAAKAALVGYRYVRTLRNAVLNARLGGPASGPAAWANGGMGASYSPSSGADANFVRLAAPTGAVRYEEFSFTETTGAGTYTADVLLPAGARLLDVQWLNLTVWTATTSARLNIGDYLVDAGTGGVGAVSDVDGYFGTDIDVKTTPANNKSISFALGDAGVGAYYATYGRGRYHSTARWLRAAVVTVGAAGSAGRSRLLVIWAEPQVGAAVKT